MPFCSYIVYCKKQFVLCHCFKAKRPLKKLKEKSRDVRATTWPSTRPFWQFRFRGLDTLERSTWHYWTCSHLAAESELAGIRQTIYDHLWHFGKGRIARGTTKECLVGLIGSSTQTGTGCPGNLLVWYNVSPSVFYLICCIQSLKALILLYAWAHLRRSFEFQSCVAHFRAGLRRALTHLKRSAFKDFRP